ncbi:hypothetical protein [Microbacterium sp. C7(2022)]|uniref:copper amine oxidase n=1 Tax=Microbacterium sp. C7(2022) TaxID=2992759 RepID=UPI00237BD261|nr:hypothetical protein [Microbacterium sp. C7(2022)]MDE0547671.1 hypothetical protein [Microbacterium sp. C7(2022)]
MRGASCAATGRRIASTSSGSATRCTGPGSVLVADGHRHAPRRCDQLADLPDGAEGCQIGCCARRAIRIHLSAGRRMLDQHHAAEGVALGLAAEAHRIAEREVGVGVDERPAAVGVGDEVHAPAQVNRVWQIASTEKTTAMGQPTSYMLFPTETPTLMAASESSIAKRAEFATKNLFVTKYDPAERYAAGDFVNQNPGGDGITAFIAGDEPLVGEDVVLWHTFGLTHFPRNEDWPVMPTDYAKFTLKPYNFFERNPTLNVPAPASAHCAAGSSGSDAAAGPAEAPGASGCADGCCG